MRLHFLDNRGHFHARPFAYALKLAEGSFDQYEEDTRRALPLKFMVRGANYRLLGLLPSRLHLFGAENERIYLLGSDAYGRDQLSRFLYGGRVSLFAGLLGAGVTVLLGLCVGAAAGYYGGWRDDLLMRLAELFLALPWLYLLFALRAFLPLAVGPLEAFFLIVAVLGAVGWARPARLVRGVVLSAKEDRKSTRLNSSHGYISYAVFCVKKTTVAHIPTNPQHGMSKRKNKPSTPMAGIWSASYRKHSELQKTDQIAIHGNPTMTA